MIDLASGAIRGRVLAIWKDLTLVPPGGTSLDRATNLARLAAREPAHVPRHQQYITTIGGSR